jgi:NADH/NAD ratio-sensing transcriptional regulator Rex
MKANKALYKKIYFGLMDSAFKYVTAENLSQSLGIYPEIIAMAMAKFDPLITMDVEANLMGLLPELEDYLKLPNRKPVVIEEKGEIGGIVDKSIVLSEEDLKVAKQLIQDELNKRKK